MNGTSHSLQIETLEGRIAPASLVNVTFTNGALVLTSDNGAHEFAIVALDATTVKLSAGTDTLFHSIGSADSDTLILTTPVKSLSVTLDAGADAVEVVGLNLPGDLKFDLGGGTNTVSFDGVTTKGGVEVIGGSGIDNVRFENGSSSIKKDLSLELGAGDNGFLIAAISLQVGGRFSYIGGAGTDAINATSSFAVKGDAEIFWGGGLNVFGELPGVELTVGKNLTFDSSASTAAMGEETRITFSTLISRINGVLKIIDGAGSLEFSTATGGIVNIGSVSIVTGPGEATVKLVNSQFNARSLTVDASASSASSLGIGGPLGSFSGNFSGKVDYTGSAGKDEITVQLAVSSVKGSGTFNADLGNGDNEVQFLASASSFKSINLTSGSGGDEIEVDLIGGSMSNLVIDNGDGQASTQVQLRNTRITGQVKVTNGTGIGGVFSFAALDSQIGAISYTSAGDGNFVDIASGAAFATNHAVVKKTITVSTGNGADTVSFDGVTNMKVGKKIDLDLGDGTNIVQGQVGNFVTKALTVTGGSGIDSVNLSGSAQLGAVNLVLGAGRNETALNGTIGPLTLSSFNLTSETVAGSTDLLSLARVQVLGKFSATLGAADSTVSIDDSVFRGSFFADTGAGTDSVVIDGADSNTGTLFVKPVNIILGDGNDALSLGGNGTTRLVIAKSKFKADGGIGTNTLTNPAGNVFAKEPVFVNLEV